MSMNWKPKPYDNPYPQLVGPDFENWSGEPLIQCWGCQDIWYELDVVVVRDDDSENNTLYWVCFDCFHLHQSGLPFFPGQIRGDRQ